MAARPKQQRTRDVIVKYKRPQCRSWNNHRLYPRQERTAISYNAVERLPHQARAGRDRIYGTIVELPPTELFRDGCTAAGQGVTPPAAIILLSAGSGTAR